MALYTRPQPGDRVRLTAAVLDSVGATTGAVTPGATGTVIEKPYGLLDMGYIFVTLDVPGGYDYVLLLENEVELVR